MMRGQPGFWDLGERYERLSAVGDPLEKLNAIIPLARVRKAIGEGVEALGWRQGQASALCRVCRFATAPRAARTAPRSARNNGASSVRSSFAESKSRSLYQNSALFSACLGALSENRATVVLVW
jgi:hypothetical protein